MKDIVENRKRIGFGQKLRLAALALKENGPLWCALLFGYYVASSTANKAFTAMDSMRRRRNLPGLNSATLNKAIWDSWDWSAQGDEWTWSEEWKSSLIHNVLWREIEIDRDVLEIGPGAGRWTGPLLERARRYVGVDISSTCIEHCRKCFGSEPRATFVLGSGRDLREVPDSTVDAIWSFDVFVHINSSEVAGYVDEFARVLRPGSVAVIHHGGVGGALGGWRSNLTADSLRDIVMRRGLQLVRSFDQWSEAGTVHTLRYGDLISVIAKPAATVATADRPVRDREGSAVSGWPKPVIDRTSSPKPVVS